MQSGTKWHQRHKWIQEMVEDTFGLDRGTVEDSLQRDERNYSKIQEFLNGTSPPRLFVYYQSSDVRNTSDELEDSGQEPRLFATFGDTDRIKSKGCYFFRNVDEGKPINTNQSNDMEVMFGEIGAEPISTLESVLVMTCIPMVKEITEWGKCEEEQKVEFLSTVNRFAADLTEAQASLTGGVELRKPDKAYEVESKPQAFTGAASDADLVAHFEKLIEEWIDKIKGYISEEASKHKTEIDAGPKTELEQWRTRNQRLTSINDQIRKNDYKNVIAVLHSASKLPSETQNRSKEKINKLLMEWKQVDIQITEALNEAKDNVKYLTTLEKFIEPLYNGTPQSIIETLPALMNSVKMIHTIARYYNTTEKMTQLFMKITNQMITRCKETILQGKNADEMWKRDADELIETMQACIKLNQAYQAQYDTTKEKLLSMPKGKQFDFSKNQIFGKFDLFCRRINKLIDMFSTVRQFDSLGKHNLEDMEDLLGSFSKLIEDFKKQRHDLLDYGSNKFDRDFVEFNVSINKLEQSLQEFITQSFEKITSTSIDQSLNLLRKFQSILKRESLQNELQSKYTLIFHSYGTMLGEIQQQYTKNNSQPPIVRNMPTVAGNIMWSRHLLQRIHDPMERFPEELKKNRDSRTHITLYNRLGLTLTAFEYLYKQAWCEQIEKAKAGLQATLIIRYPQNQKLYVNFDHEILQLIRESKCLERMGIPIPESARIVLLQEEKFKNYYNELLYVLKEYERVIGKIRPITKILLGPHLEDLEYKLKPGMVTLTWTSMNIDGYLQHVHNGLSKLEQLIISINDIIENRIENNLKAISKVVLVEMPEDNRTYSQDEFVELQHKSAKLQTDLLTSKNIEVERAVDDLLNTICAYQLDQHVGTINPEEITKLKKYYNWTMYQALLHCTKNSLNAMKNRVCEKRTKDSLQPLSQQSPFFEVDVKLEAGPETIDVKISPTLEDVQEHINRAAIAVLKCSKSVINWFQQEKADHEEKESFYDMIAQDKEIVKVILLLTGSIHGTKNLVSQYLETFMKYQWLWKENPEERLKKFSRSDPTIDDFEEQLKKFTTIESEIEQLEAIFQIGAMALKTELIKEGLIKYAQKWKYVFSRDLHKRAKSQLEYIFEYISQTTAKLEKEVNGIDTLGYVMRTMKEVRQKEGEIELELKPLLDMYNILDLHLTHGMDKEEQDNRHILRNKWNSLVNLAEKRQNELSETQNSYKRDLIKSVKFLITDVKEFRTDYDKNGPMVNGIKPREAVERLRRFKEEYSVRERNYEINHAGEELFGLPNQQYPELEKSKKELALLGQLYDLYVAVIDTLTGWKECTWVESVEKIQSMTELIDEFANKCKRLPRQLKDFEAYLSLRQEIEDFQQVLPLLAELSKSSIKPRHWQEVKTVTNCPLKVDTEEIFYLSNLLEANLLEYRDEIEEITESADKQLKIEQNLKDITETWSEFSFEFEKIPSRENPCKLVGSKVQEIQEELEETQAALTTMNAMKHVTPFKAEVTDKLNTFSEVGENIDRWIKVQMLWSSLEPVFMGGDIARAMPTEAKKFSQIDKTWMNLMDRAAQTGKVVPCCQNEMLKNLLPSLFETLEQCQKSLDNYLETKRAKFPRFYFTSSTNLLIILSGGSEPATVIPFLENLFAGISKIEFSKVDRKLITHMIGSFGQFDEPVPLTENVKAEGNIEDWLKALEHEQQRTMRDIIRGASKDVNNMELKAFIDHYYAQVAMLGIQLLWTGYVQEGLEKLQRERAILNVQKQKINNMMTVLIQSALDGQLNKLQRCKIEAMVTIHVHQRDVFIDLQAFLAKDTGSKGNFHNNFEWLKQTRFTWRMDMDTCLIQITDQDFNYMYEYLGIEDRLCITPLTDRCYITLAQALGMYYGGAPAGPAGTGKTETTKDMGKSLGVYVVVTNCSDQHGYKDMAKIFKGLCQSGLWGCFDEFNRIKLEVISVVADQINSINKAKKDQQKQIIFPGESSYVTFLETTAIFITMNPGYAGRTELPENLKVLFRGVAMCVPDRYAIIKVKLASVGFDNFEPLAKKFTVLYALCEEQLSKQRHYDFGLRNILSILRSAGNIKRESVGKSEEMLLMRTLRDMNLSKLVLDDVDLFLQLLKDIFPDQAAPEPLDHGAMVGAIKESIEEKELINFHPWYMKIIQFYEQLLVRHGLMIVGPTGTGKTRLLDVLMTAMSKTHPHRKYTINPKAITDQELYGQKIDISDEWIPGVFSTIWAKQNNRNLKYNSWITFDGPVDTIWIESLNSVLDDNRLLTLANNDRIAMTDNVKLIFEPENLNNASPATVSRCGIVFISTTDLTYYPLLEAWVKFWASPSHENRKQEANEFEQIFEKYFKQYDIVKQFFLQTGCSLSMKMNDNMLVHNFLALLSAILKSYHGEIASEAYERIALYCISWAIGGMLMEDVRPKWHEWLSAKGAPLPNVSGKDTVFEYYIDPKTKQWVKWAATPWKKTKDVKFASLLIPTMDSCRSEYLMQIFQDLPLKYEYKKELLLVGVSGTAKTSTILMFCENTFGTAKLLKKVNFSSATLPKNFQDILESSLEKRNAKNYAPPGQKIMCVFIDDMSMPEINAWGDQITLEIVRQVVEDQGIYFLDKDKRGDRMSIENLTFIGAMNTPIGGRNPIPQRLLRHHFAFCMVLPSTDSIDNIYGEMIRTFFTPRAFNPEVAEAGLTLVQATIQLWDKIKNGLLPTPAKFHYAFNMRELSRVFQGIFEVIKCREGKDVIMKARTVGGMKPEVFMVGLWKHECLRTFEDKLVTPEDKNWASQQIDNITLEFFDREVADQLMDPIYFCDFMREDVLNEEGEVEEDAPKVYEGVRDIKFLRNKCNEFLEDYNKQSHGKSMNLVLFDDALKHLMRISRIIQMDRGNALLVGVGGSGKQSLTRLAAFIGQHKTFQITLSKSYNVTQLFEDLKQLYKWAGHEQGGAKTTFILTDSEIKDEIFLEYINSILSTGEVANLLPKEEKDIIIADMRGLFQKQFPHIEEPNVLDLFNYFIDKVRNNLHVVLCFSPAGTKFRERFRKFPALFNATSINWFLPWPEEALLSVAQQFVSDFQIYATEDIKQALTEHMGRVHKMVGAMCDTYFAKMSRQVFVTPKSYLSFIASFKSVYGSKLAELEEQEGRVKLGLEKLADAAEEVKKMEVILAEENKKIQEATEHTEKMLKELEIEKSKAETKRSEVQAIADDCQEKQETIERETAEANKDLQKALPFLENAIKAVDSIKPADISTLKALRNPAAIITLVFDGVLLLQHMPILPTKADTKKVAGQDIPWIKDSYAEHATPECLTDTNFLKKLISFSQNDKDNINDETCELLEPYLREELFDPGVAKNASGAAQGLCTWVGAMVQYHEAAKIVKPKMDFLAIQRGRLEEAQKQYGYAQEQLKEAEDVLAGLQATFDKALAEKNLLVENATKTQNKMKSAKKLIDSLFDEKVRWTEDSNNFNSLKQRLIGDVAAATAFVSYCGPFNAEYRNLLMKDYFIKDLKENEIPVTVNLELTKFLVDAAMVGEWNLQGLPKDDLSTQNAIMVTRSSRYPLMIDPQGQAVKWITQKEGEELLVTNQNARNFKDEVRFCIDEGKPCLVEAIENEVDPGMDPVLERQYIIRGNKKKLQFGDQLIDFSDHFNLFMTSRLGNPRFSPELAAKTTIIDFTVTLLGLEQQLLGRVISKEKKSLEESLQAIMEDITMNTKTLLQYDKALLERLTSTTGNLLDDLELIEVLNATKAKSKEVHQKLVEADEKQKDISEKREQYRRIATRGSILYFVVVEMSLVNWMYNTSLGQFLVKFDEAIDKADKNVIAETKKIENIEAKLTYVIFRYINKGLFVKDKMTFVLMVCLKILVTAGKLNSADIAILLRSGFSLDAKTEKPNPFSKWIQNEQSWLNILALSRHHYGREGIGFFRELPESIQRADDKWKEWYLHQAPEECPIPDEYEQRINSEKEIGKFIHLTLVRSLREDRTVIFAMEFIRDLLGPEYTAPTNDSIEDIWHESTSREPVLFLLSAGADPTQSIEDFAKKKKKSSCERISMGEGMDVPAREAMKSAFLTGNWVILQNCHLGLEFMAEMETLLGKGIEIEEDFRLWLTCEPRADFPIGLLQMAQKVSVEPPAGIKAGLSRTFHTIITNDFLEKHDTDKWRKISYVICFLHSIVQERRKFGPLGFSIPYEFNTTDLDASLLFLDRHIYNAEAMNTNPSWDTIKFMVCEIQYGGRITDWVDLDLFYAYGHEWLDEKIMNQAFTFNNEAPNSRNFKFIIPDGVEVQKYRDFIELVPEKDSPGIFGLHENADLAKRKRESAEMLDTILMTQPREGGSSSGKGRNEIVKEKCQELATKVPPDYITAEVMEDVKKLGGPKNTTEKGKKVPLNNFLTQEIARMQHVINIVNKVLNDICEAIDGLIIMTPEIVDALDAIYDARVPHEWIYDALGGEISWIIPILGQWFGSLADRCNQLSGWLKSGSQRPITFWMTGFFNPQGFLTSMRQEVTRQHEKDSWALDDVVDSTEILQHDIERLRDGPAEGVYIRGLFLEGARWTKSDGGRLDELEGKLTYVPMPVVHVSAKQSGSKGKGGKDSYENYGMYNCPVYKYTKRTTKYLISHINLRCEGSALTALHWKLRGVAILCSVD